MLLDVSRALKDPGQSYPFTAVADIVPTEQFEVMGDPVCFSDVRLSGELLGTGDAVKVYASVSGDVESRCARCLEPVKLHLESEITALFSRTPDADDPDQYPMEGYKIEINDMAREALLLEMPMRFLCREDCKGLCPVCGTNLNIAPCTCQEGGARRNPFSALSDLLTKDEEV